METSKVYYIAGYLNGNQIGVIDSSDHFNVSDNLDYSARKFFDIEEDAMEYIEKLQSETNHPNFEYKVEYDE